MQMSFKTKIIGGFLAVGLVPLALVSGFLLYEAWVESYRGSSAALEAVHDQSIERLEDHLKLVKTQVTERAQAMTTRQAMKEFPEAVRAMSAARAGLDTAKLEERYKVQVEKTPGAKPEDAAKWMPESEAAKALQYLYIVKNTNPLGEKDKLKDAGDGSLYSMVHAKYHSGFKRAVDAYGYYDMMLVDAESGDVVYSDFKEIDFMSNVKHGPLADTVFARTAKKALGGNDPTVVTLSDFEEYVPSYKAWAGFAAAPIVEDGRVLGAVVFQMSLDKLQDVFAYTQKMGASADGFLVGPDMKFRSKSFTLKMDVGSDLPGNLSKEMERVFKDNYSGPAEWWGGDDGKTRFYGMIQKLNVPELNWGVVVRIKKSDMLAGFYSQLYIAMGIIAVVALVCVGVGLFLANMVVKPVQGLATGFSRGQDRVLRSASEMNEAVSAMVAASEETSAQSRVIRQSSNEASGHVASVTNAIEELNVSIHDISRSIGETNILIDDAVGKAQRTDEVVRTLGEASKRITEVVSLINDLAEQTNLLALNAAIEAARAGDAGRGFAVVADEVKKLASHTSQATVDIKSQITEIQDVSDQSVVALQAVVEAIHRIRDNATTVSAAVEEQSGVARQIAGSIKDAANRVQDVDRNMNGIEQAASDTSVAASQVNSSVADVQNAVGGMKRDVEGVLDEMGMRV